MNNIDRLQETVDNLKKLLDDQQPGLFTWQLAVENETRKIKDFYYELYELKCDCLIKEINNG